MLTAELYVYHYIMDLGYIQDLLSFRCKMFCNNHSRISTKE
jgi:hypothetical protein